MSVFGKRSALWERDVSWEGEGGVEICEQLLRNYASHNRLGNGNLRVGAQSFDLMANCIIWNDNSMASTYMCLILINLH